MIDLYFEPLESYETEFKPNFAQAVRDKFEELFTKSKVDADANKKLVEHIRNLQAECTSQKRKKLFFVILMILLFIAGIVAGFMLYQGGQSTGMVVLLSLGMVAAIALAIYLIVVCVKLQKKINSLTDLIAEQIAEAYRQMSPLNQLFTWRTMEELVEKVIPGMAFDSVYSVDRHQDMIENFDCPGDFGDDAGVCQCVTGKFRENPFALINLREMEWGEKMYEGSLTISWEEEETDSDGNSRTVTRYQTLTATLTKPYPEYNEYKMLYFGHEITPGLSFSREPSDLSGKTDGFFAKFSKKRALNKLKDKARKMDADSKFTLVSNHDFEVLFHADDRNDEHEFRVLFTPLAQNQMVKYLNDKKVGFGDNFDFRKMLRTTLIVPEHLQQVSISTDPEQFRFYDLEESREFFIKRNEEFFTTLYFTFAPLWTIPAYQDPRHETPAQQSERNRKIISPWACEMLAYAYGEEYFRHEESVTSNILKTRLNSIDSNGVAHLTVSANGFRIEPRVDYVSVYGRDGNYHDVPVHWDEFLPVCNVKQMSVLRPDSDTTDAGDENTALAAARAAGLQEQTLRYYKNWISYLG